MATATKKVAPATAPLANPKGLFVFMASDKGGVGKTMIYRFLVEFLRKLKPGKIAAYDGDGGTGSGVRIHGTRDGDGYLLEEQDPIKGVVAYNIRKNRAREEFVNSISTGAPIIIHDLPGGAFDALSEIVDRGNETLQGILKAVINEGYQPVIVHAVHHEDESTESVSRYLDATEGLPVIHVAVLNYRDADSADDFELWNGFINASGEQEGGRTKARVEATGGFEIVMPKLMASASSRIKRNNLTFSDAYSDPKKKTLLTIAQRSQVEHWYEDFTAAFLESEPFKALFKI